MGSQLKQPQSLFSSSFLHFIMKLSSKLFGLAFVATVLVNGQDEGLVDKVKDAVGDGNELTEAVIGVTTDLKSCNDDWESLYDSNEALPIAHEALVKSMTLDTDSSKTVESSEKSYTLTFSADELANYEELCNKSEDGIWFSPPDTTTTCEYDGGSEMTTVVNYGECYPDSESCKSLYEQTDAINEHLLKILWDLGYKCAFDGADGFYGMGEDVSSSSENPWDRSGDDELSTGATPMKMLGLAVTAVLGLMMII